MTKTNLYATLSGIFCASLIISNILAFKTFSILSFTLPTAVIIFPIVYICNDTMTEVFGYEKAKHIITTAFIMNIVAVIAYNVAIVLPSPVFFQGQEAFQMVLSNSLRVLIASLSAYIIGSLANAKVMANMKGNSKLFTRCVLSTLIGEGLDACIFIFIAFLGTMPFQQLIVMIIAQALFKTIYEIMAFPITRKVINKVQTL